MVSSFYTSLCALKAERMAVFQKETLEAYKYADLVKVAKEHDVYRRYAPKVCCVLASDFVLELLLFETHS